MSSAHRHKRKSERAESRLQDFLRHQPGRTRARTKWSLEERGARRAWATHGSNTCPGQRENSGPFKIQQICLAILLQQSIIIQQTRCTTNTMYRQRDEKNRRSSGILQEFERVLSEAGNDSPTHERKQIFNQFRHVLRPRPAESAEAIWYVPLLGLRRDSSVGSAYFHIVLRPACRRTTMFLV